MSLIELLGHTSFAVGAAAWFWRDVLKIRLISIIASALSILFNVLVWYKIPPSDSRNELFVVIVWICIIATINIVMLIKTIRDSLEKELNISEKVLMAQTFPHMHSRDWDALIAIGRTTVHKPNTLLLEKGEKTTAITFVMNGVVSETRGKTIRECPEGTMWGELTFVFGDEFNKSPVDIVCKTDVCCLHFEYATLRSFCASKPRADAAILRGIVRSAGLKHGLLWVKADEPTLYEEKTKTHQAENLSALGPIG